MQTLSMAELECVSGGAVTKKYPTARPTKIDASGSVSGGVSISWGNGGGKVDASMGAHGQIKAQ